MKVSHCDNFITTIERDGSSDSCTPCFQASQELEFAQYLAPRSVTFMGNPNNAMIDALYKIFKTLQIKRGFKFNPNGFEHFVSHRIGVRLDNFAVHLSLLVERT